MKNKILVLFDQEWALAELRHHLSSAPFQELIIRKLVQPFNDLAREMRWLGSHRYATLNLGGENRHDLEQRYRAVCREFALEAH